MFLNNLNPLFGGYKEVNGNRKSANRRQRRQKWDVTNSIFCKFLLTKNIVVEGSIQLFSLIRNFFMKKTIIIIFVLIAAGIIWFYPIFSPLSSYTDSCWKATSISRTATDMENLALAEKNFEQCKIALAENDKRFKDSSWKKEPWCKLYGYENIPKIIASPRNFKCVRESNAILDKLLLDTTIISAIKTKTYKDESGASAIIDEYKSIVTQYKAYCELNNEPEFIEKHKQFIKEKFLNKKNNTKSKKQNIRPFK